jgi:hypothetical protein
MRSPSAGSRSLATAEIGELAGRERDAERQRDDEHDRPEIGQLGHGGRV